jgi:hypothetical protein
MGYGLVYSCQIFRGNSCHFLTKQALWSSKMLVSI